MKKAFSFIEVLVAGTLFLVISIPLLTLSDQSTQQTGASIDELRASHMAREIVEIFQSNQAMGGFYAYPSDRDEFLDFDFGPSNLCDQIDCTKQKLPGGYRRLYRFRHAHPGKANAKGLVDLYQLDVIIQWKYKSDEYNRQIKMSTMLAADRIFEW